MSAHGLERLISEEGLRLDPYNDSAGHATVGVGHLIHHGPVTTADNAHFKGFTKADALVLLAQDVRPREQFVEGAVTVDLGQNEFDALVSLVFNIGTGAFATSTVLHRLNAGARHDAADAFLLFVIGGAGLANRRKRERGLFLTRDEPDPLAGFTASERRWIREYDRLKAQDADRPRRSVLRRVMTEQRKRIWRTAQDSGWSKANRRSRYRSLLARTT
jgi:GH24 family phage-related lysozyme (muramidase)